MSMLRVEGIEVRYGRVVAVTGVSLRVEAGEFVGIIGPNGAGKSTTMLAVMRMVGLTAGDVLLEGKSIRALSPEEVARNGIALVPEGRRILHSLSVAENLEVGKTAATDRLAARRREQELLERFPVLGRYYRSSAGTLSGGEQQQLAIARALVAGPRLLLLDEPSLGLAPMVVDSIFETMRELREDGATILLVEQNAARTVAAADRTYVLRSGRVLSEDTRENYARRGDLASTYFGE